jgi:hypothetical protein
MIKDNESKENKGWRYKQQQQRNNRGVKVKQKYQRDKGDSMGIKKGKIKITKTTRLPKRGGEII